MAPLGDVDDVVAWWGVGIKFVVELLFIPIFWFFLSLQHHSIQYSILSKIAMDYQAPEAPIYVCLEQLQIWPQIHNI